MKETEFISRKKGLHKVEFREVTDQVYGSQDSSSNKFMVPGFTGTGDTYEFRACDYWSKPMDQR